MSKHLQRHDIIKRKVRSDGKEINYKDEKKTVTTSSPSRQKL